YSSGTTDIEYLYPIGWSELEGVANRGDFDLTQHTQHSGTKLEFVGDEGERYTPYVIEPAVSIERIFVAMLVGAYDEEVVAERDRDSLAQERLPIGGVRAWLEEALDRPWRTPSA